MAKLQSKDKKKKIGKLPVKRTINLATVNVQKIKLYIAIPGIILIVFLAALFSKFAVIDRLMDLEAAKREVTEKQRMLDANYEAIEGFGEINEQYAHYTYSGMTEEELTRADRSLAMSLIDEKVLPFAAVNEWSLEGNVLTLTITGTSLQLLNAIVADLEEEPIVDYCTLNTAKTDEHEVKTSETSKSYSVVTGKLTAYLNAVSQEEER